MSTFPEFDFSAILGDEADELREDNGVIDGLNDEAQSAPITTPPPPVTHEIASTSTTPKSRKRSSKNSSHNDEVGIGYMASLLDSVVNSVASDFQIAADIEVSSNTNNRYNNLRESSPSPNQLMVADEYLNTEEGNNEEASASVAPTFSPPVSPDGITNEDRGSARCETCDISFSTKRQRCEHLRDVHGVEKPFKCEHCGARFPYSSSLYNHARIHSANRPFKCSLCDSSFRWKNSLRHHRLYIHKEDPGTVMIASKCVWEGKKPPPPDMPLPSVAGGPKDANAGPTNSESAPPPPKKPREKKSRSSSKRSSNANGTSPPFEIDVAKLLEQAEKAFANSFTPENANTSGGSGAISKSLNTATATPAAVGPKRKRKPKATFRRNDLGEAVSSSGVVGKGHTCGHCEKEFAMWVDLVTHIKDCAEKEKSTLNDGAGANWMPAEEIGEGEGGLDGNQDGQSEGEGDPEAPGGLVIDPMGGGIRQDSFDEEEVIDASTNYNSDSIGGISREMRFDEERSEILFDANSGDANLEYRIQELEKRLDEVSNIYEARIEALESSVSRLKSLLTSHEQA